MLFHSFDQTCQILQKTRTPMYFDLCWQTSNVYQKYLEIFYILLMSQLQYKNKFNPQQLHLICQSKGRKQILVRTQIQRQALFQFPYHFETKQRTQYIKNKYQKLIQDKLKKDSQILTKLIIIRKVKAFDHKEEDNIEETWVIDRNTMETVKNVKGSLCRNWIGDFQRGYISHKKAKQQNKFENMLFFGRSQIPNRSITIKDNTSISNKHMLLIKQTNSCDNILIFLLCCHRATIQSNQTKLTYFLSNLDIQIIKTIVSYLGKIPNYKYYLIDNNSTNGTYYYPYGEMSITNKTKQLLIISKQQGFAIKINSVLKKTKLSNIKVNIDHVIAEIMRSGNIQVVNRSQQNENLVRKQEENFSVLILTVKTPRKNKTYILYSSQQPYKVIKHEQDINIIHNDQFCQGICCGQVRCSEQGWKLYSKQIYFCLKGNTHYRIKNEAYVSLGNSAKFIITLQGQYLKE